MKNYKKSAIILIGTLGGLSAQAADSVLEIRLNTLEKNPTPKILDSAMMMCYRMALPPKSADYICPACGEKARYVNNQEMGELIQWRLPKVRLKFKKWQSKGISIVLDERLLCPGCTLRRDHCESFAMDSVLFFEITHSDSTVHRSAFDPVLDLAILDAFFEQKDRVDLGRGLEKPLKNYLPQLRKLLGIPKPEEKKNIL